MGNRPPISTSHDPSPFSLHVSPPLCGICNLPDRHFKYNNRYKFKNFAMKNKKENKKSWLTDMLTAENHSEKHFWFILFF